jgi:hypothetical protein
MLDTLRVAASTNITRLTNHCLDAAAVTVPTPCMVKHGYTASKAYGVLTKIIHAVRQYRSTLYCYSVH